MRFDRVSEKCTTEHAWVQTVILENEWDVINQVLFAGFFILFITTYMLLYLVRSIECGSFVSLW